MFCNCIDTHSMSCHCLVCMRLSHSMKDYLLTYVFFTNPLKFIGVSANVNPCSIRVAARGASTSLAHPDTNAHRCFTPLNIIFDNHCLFEETVSGASSSAMTKRPCYACFVFDYRPSLFVKSQNCTFEPPYCVLTI